MRLRYEGLVLDLLYGRAESPEETVDLTLTEVRLLAWLHGHADRWVSNEELLQHVWGYSSASRSHTVRTTVNRLRKKLDVAGQPELVHTRTGQGYKLRLPPAADPWSAARVDPFVGRELQLEWLDQALQQARLACVVGAGGIGKTRLVAQAVRSRAARTVGVLDAGDHQAVLRRLARSLDIHGDADLARRVAVTLAGQGVRVLVLDDLHALREPDRQELVRGLLTHEPRLTLLCTARGGIDLAGARVLALGPLELDAAVSLLQALRPDPEDVGSSEDLRTLADVVDRVPLALELAAGCLDVLSAEELVSRVRDRGEQLGVAAAMALSWAQLDHEQRRVLHQLTVFRGGWTATAAEAVVQSSNPVLAVLRDLVRRSLVHRGAASRQQLLLPVRELITDRCGAAPADSHERLARWLGEHAPAHAAAGLRDNPTRSRAWLDDERANLEHASRWAIGGGHPTAPELVITVAQHDHDGGRPGPRSWIHALLQHQGSGATRARLLLALSEPYDGRPATWLALANEALEQVQPESPLWVRARLAQASALYADGQPATAAAHVEEALAAPGLRPGLHSALLRKLGDCQVALGDPTAAEASHQQALQLAAAHELVESWAWSAVRYAILRGEAGDLETARGLLDRVVTTARAHGLSRVEVHALQRRAALAAQAGELEPAEQDLQRAVHLCAAHGDLRQQADVWFRVGVSRLDPQDRDALVPLDACLELLARLGALSEPTAFMARSARALARADAGEAAEALDELRAASASRPAPAAAVARALELHEGVLLAVAGRRDEAVARARAADVAYRESGTLQAQVEAVALLAALDEPGAAARAADLPDSLCAVVGPLRRLLSETGPSVEDRRSWLWVRLLARVMG